MINKIQQQTYFSIGELFLDASFGFVGGAFSSSLEFFPLIFKLRSFHLIRCTLNIFLAPETHPATFFSHIFLLRILFGVFSLSAAGADSMPKLYKLPANMYKSVELKFTKVPTAVWQAAVQR
jgi:hypothetical protein